MKMLGINSSEWELTRERSRNLLWALVVFVLVLLIIIVILLVMLRHRRHVIDPFVTGTGSDGASKISSIINDPSLCPGSGMSVGCVIDAQNPHSVTDQVWQINPFHGPNRPVVLLLGPHTYVACVPIVSGQYGYMVIGVKAAAQIPHGTRIRPGTAADGCVGTFPNGASQLNFEWQHGLYPAGTYAALYNDCGDTTQDRPGNTADCFGGEIWHVQFEASVDDKNPTTPQPAANFLYYSSAVEERGGLFDTSLKNCITACVFLDRNNQTGPPSPGGSGPVHFTMRDLVMIERTDGLGDLKTDGLVMEGNTTRIVYSGQSDCAETTNPTASGEPTAYIYFYNGNPNGSATVTNGGNCATPPTSCTLMAASKTATGGYVKSSGATCALTLLNGKSTPVLTTTISCIGDCATQHNYPTAAVPGGGPLIERVTIAGSDATHRFRNAIAIEGDRDTEVNHIHTERIGNPGVNPGSNGDAVLHGFGTAPYSGGTFMAINVTSGVGGCIHQGVGGLSSDVSMIDITRELSNGCVIVDDNIIDPLTNKAFTLSTTDSPSHRRVAFYGGGGNALVFGKPNSLFPCKAQGTAASPSVVACGAATSGAFSCAINASGRTCQVKTTQITATNQVLLTQVSDESSYLGTTCNNVASNMHGAWVSARIPGDSFTISLPAFIDNPLCFTFQIAN